MANYSGRGYQRRNEIARAKGFASYSAYRKASPGAQAKATAALAKRDAGYRKSGAEQQAKREAPQRRRRLEQDLGAAGNVIISMVDRDLRRWLRRMRSEQMRVYGHPSIVELVEETETGRKIWGPPRVLALWSRGGVDPDWLLDTAAAMGRVRDVIEDQISKVYGLEGEWKLVQIQLLASY